MDLITTPAAVGYSPPSTSVVHNAAVSLTERAPASIVHLVQYDTTVPIVAISLAANGQPYTVPGGAAVNVRMKKPDGHFVYDPALGLANDSQTAYIGVTLQMTAAFGKSTPIIEIVVDGNVAATGTFMLDIDENQVPESAIESTDEYLTIQQLAAEVTGAAKVIQDNLDAINAISTDISDVKTTAENIEVIKTTAENMGAVKTTAESIEDVKAAVADIDAIKAAPEEAKKAADSATLSQSWAVGGTGTREGEDENNAKYWAGESAKSANGFLGAFDTPEELTSAHPTAAPGQIAVVMSTRSVWVWDSTASAWLDTVSHIYKATFSVSGWSGEKPYTQTVEAIPVDGGPAISASSVMDGPVFMDDALTGHADLVQAAALVDCGVKTFGAGTITCFSDWKPTADAEVYFKARMKGV